MLGGGIRRVYVIVCLAGCFVGLCVVAGIEHIEQETLLAIGILGTKEGILAV